MPVASIKSWNGLRADMISVGQRLSVKNGARIHVVVKEESLWGIAKKYNTTVEKIKTVNGLKY